MWYFKEWQLLADMYELQSDSFSYLISILLSIILSISPYLFIFNLSFPNQFITLFPIHPLSHSLVCVCESFLFFLYLLMDDIDNLKFLKFLRVPCVVYIHTHILTLDKSQPSLLHQTFVVRAGSQDSPGLSPPWPARSQGCRYRYAGPPGHHAQSGTPHLLQTRQISIVINHFLNCLDCRCQIFCLWTWGFIKKTNL